MKRYNKGHWGFRWTFLGIINCIAHTPYGYYYEDKRIVFFLCVPILYWKDRI